MGIQSGPPNPRPSPPARPKPEAGGEVITIQEQIVDRLIFDFTMVYTSPLWGSDERSPEGWEQKKEALKKIFSAPVGAMVAHIAAAEQEKEKAWQMYERARKERADVLMVKSVEGLTMSEWQLRLAKAESEVRNLTAEVEEWKRKSEEANAELNSVLDSRLEGYRALGDRAANAENERDDALVALRALAERVETMQKMLLAWCAGDSHWGDMTLRDASLATLAEQGIELPRISSFLHDGKVKP